MNVAKSFDSLLTIDHFVTGNVFTLLFRNTGKFSNLILTASITF